jgi:putative transposase
VWIPKYRKAVLTGELAIRVRDLLRQIAAEHELEIVSGKVARDHVHLLVSYRPNQQVSQIMQWLKGISSRVLLQEFAYLRKQFCGRHFWARGYLAVSSGTITEHGHAITLKFVGVYVRCFVEAFRCSWFASRTRRCRFREIVLTLAIRPELRNRINTSFTTILPRRCSGLHWCSR